MKKTKLMRAALLLLVLTLITSCFVGGTFAKYTTSAEGSDTARVAKWGFKDASVVLTDLFNTNYNNVLSTENVIAPGTKGNASFGFTYGGDNNATAPEVAYTFKVSADESTCDPSIKKNTNIKWSLDGAVVPAAGSAVAGSWDALLAAIKNLSGDPSGEETYAPGNLPGAFKTADGAYMHTVAWEWAFETANDATQDKNDTDMGNANPLATVTLKITVSATQVD